MIQHTVWYLRIIWGRFERNLTLLVRNLGVPAKNVELVLLYLSKPCRLYSLLKIHKQGVPMRHSVSTVGLPTYTVAKYLTQMLSPFVGNYVHHVTNSFEFVTILGSILYACNLQIFRWVWMWFRCLQKYPYWTLWNFLDLYLHLK